MQPSPRVHVTLFTDNLFHRGPQVAHGILALVAQMQHVEFVEEKPNLGVKMILCGRCDEPAITPWHGSVFSVFNNFNGF